jgi:hypothetical protein
MIVEKLEHAGRVFAILISPSYEKTGVQFLTPLDALLQVGIMNWPTGHRIQPHGHLPIERAIQGTQEVLFVKKGKLRANFYDETYTVVLQRDIGEGDFICLLEGAHGFDVLEDVQIVEVKNGPYAGNLDKMRFEGKLK